MRRFRETEVNMPSGNVDKPLIEDNRDGTVSVKYEPKEEGLHELVVKYNGENVQETSQPTAPLAMPIVEISDQSAGSQASAGFVPTVRPPVGWLQTSTSGRGRWRQQHDDPYQAPCPLQRLLATDTSGGGSDSDRLGNDEYAHVDKLKKSAMAADFRPKEDVKKPEWVKIAEEGMRNRERVAKFRSFPGTRNVRTEEFPSKEVECYHNFHGVVIPKYVLSEKEANDKETADVSENKWNNCKEFESGYRPSSGKSENEYPIDHKSEMSESPMERIILTNSMGFKGLHPIPDPFTFGKRPKPVNSVHWNSFRPVQKSGGSSRVFIKERFISSNARGRNLHGLDNLSENEHCICKDFIRSEPTHTWSGKCRCSHSMTEEVLQKDKTYTKNYSPEMESYANVSSTVEKSVTKRILKMGKTISKTDIVLKTDDSTNSTKSNMDSKKCENDVRSSKTELSVKFTEGLEKTSQAAKSKELNSAKSESSVNVSTEKETASQTTTSVAQDSENLSSPKMSPLVKTYKGKETSSQTTPSATKTLETQTSRETEEAAMGTETASQTNVIMSPDFETRSDGCQTDTPARPDQRAHSTTLVVPARKSSLRSLTTDGAGGDPCAPCPSAAGGGGLSESRHLAAARPSLASTPMTPASQPTVRSTLSVAGGGGLSVDRRLAAARPPPATLVTPASQPIVRSTLSVAGERRRCRRRAELPSVDSSDDSYVSAAAALPTGAAPRRRGLDELSLTSRCSTAAESGGFLSASSSCESLRSALAAPEAVGLPPRPVLGIPMSGARPAAGEKPGRAAERQQRRCSRTLEQLGMALRLRSSDTTGTNTEAASLSGNDSRGWSGDGAGGGRPVAGGGVFRSATSVSEVAPCSGGDEKQTGQQGDTTWGKWRRAVGTEKQRQSADGVSELCADRAAKYQLKHSVHVKSSTGSPFKFHVDSISSGYVTAHGPGLVHGITGEPANFTIATKDAGAGGLSLAVEGPSKAEISCHDNKDGTVSVSYLPTSPGEYKVAVKFADKHIKGSPYSVKVTGEGRKRNQVSLGSQSEVTLPGKVTEKDIKALNASITAPSGLEEPCFLKKLANDHLGISFTPREIGQHLVMVKKKGVEISGSPFKIMVSPKEVGNASKVKVSGAALKEGKTHQDNKVLIDTKEAGYGGLSMSIEGPSKAEIKCDDKDDGKLEVSYNPKEPGFYIINLKFADHHVAGSPFTAKVTGEGSNTQTERIKRERDAAPITAVGSSCALTFKMPGVSALDLSATVASPGGVVEDASIAELEDNLHAVNFVPKELGVHTVSVRYRDVHIPGSPFQFTVGPLKDGGAHRVHAGGPGLERGEQNMPNEFNVWTREAGAGSLAISVEGPSKADIDFQDRKDGSCYVSYVVSEPGEYRVGVKFNDSHIPESPYKVYVTPANKDAHRVSVNQLPDAGVQVDKPIVFMVDRSGCKGQLDCKTVSPSGHEDDCFATYLDEDTYSVRFLPKENGIHQLHVKWNSVHVPGSPFRLKVGKQDADPAAVHAHGKGLEQGQTGHKGDFIVDTCNAGAGTLAVTIDGPSKVAMDCTEVDEGYKVRYTPLSPGHYYVGVKYDGYHIAGSPFKVDVDGDELAERGPKEQSAVVVETIEKVSVSKQQVKGPSMPKFNSDATQVTSKGMGLKKAFVGRQNQFTVDAGLAGQDMLWVGCYGPKNPCEEVHIKHVGRNQYQVFYTVKERGKYILVVRWGEQDIPGSPFEVEV